LHESRKSTREAYSSTAPIKSKEEKMTMGNSRVLIFIIHF
jgi:hypothetical protein